MIDLTGVKASGEPRSDKLKVRRPKPGLGTVRPGSDAPMGIAEVITVCMGKLLHELREFLPAARLAFPTAPIYVYTDDVAAVVAAADAYLVSHVVPVHACAETPDFSLVVSHAPYWQAAPIYYKLKGLLDRVTALPRRDADGILIVDCDVTFRHGFERPFRGDVALSPFYWGRRDLTTKTGGLLQHSHGEFNAGMLVTRSVDFCNWWLESYLTGFGGFYEQGCLDAVPQRFRTDYISPLHNFGKWRFSRPNSAVRSYHQHVRERSWNCDVGALKIAAQRTAAEARATLRKGGDA